MSKSKTPKWIYTYSNGVVCYVRNRNPIALIFREIYQFDFYAIYINPQDTFPHRTFHISLTIWTESLDKCHNWIWNGPGIFGQVEDLYLVVIFPATVAVIT